MKLAQTILSYPVKTFNAIITHSTPRKSTAIEWAILEAVGTTQKFPQLQSITIGELFSGILKIGDINGFFKRHIANLMDIGALIYDNSIIDERTDLYKIGMRNLQMTESGTNMQSKGLLPGAERSDTQKFELNIFTGDVAFAGKNDELDARAIGINVCDDDSIREAPLPSMKISELLDHEMVSDKNELTWLTPSSIIQKISEFLPLNEKEPWGKISWINQAHIINIDGKGNVTSQGMDEALISKTIDLLEDNDSTKAVNHSVMTKCDAFNFDTDVDRIVLGNDIPAVIEKMKQNNRIFIKNTGLYSATVNITPKGEPNVLINYGAQEFDCRYDEKNKLLNMDIPKDSQYENFFNSTLFIAGQVPLKANTFTVSIGNSSRELTLSYLPKNGQFPLTEFVTPIVEKYAGENPDILNLLPLTRQYDLFNKMVQKTCDKHEDMAGKIRFLSALRDSNKRFFGRTFLTPENENTFLFHHWIQEDLSTEQAFQRVQELTSETFIRNNPDRLIGGFSKLLEHWKERENIELFWKIIATVNRGTKMEAYMSSSSVIDQLYTDRILEQMILQFGNIPTDIKKTDLSEEILLEMQKVYKKIMAKTSAIGYDAEKRKEIQELDTLLINMRQLYSKLANYIKKCNPRKANILDINHFLQDKYQAFNDMVKQLESISRWVNANSKKSVNDGCTIQAKER